MKHIPWFNPREMDDDTVLAVSTGRESLLEEVVESVDEQLSGAAYIENWLITGMRGAGKSFFLRLLQVKINREFAGTTRLVLLPEELRNIHSAHELLSEIQRLLQPGHLGHAPQFRTRNQDVLWEKALKDLLSSFTEPVLLIGIENFDKLLKRAFSSDEDNSRLRHLLSHEPRLKWIVTAVQGDFDENHHQRLFRQFEHRKLPLWNVDDHRDYLSRRARLEQRTPSKEQLNRIDAYSRYTGGNARAAAILAATILDMDEATLAATDLDAAIEKMSDYYRAQIDRIPDSTSKLFDALLRGGEPASQTAIAERTGAKQNEISRAFIWLVDNGYVQEWREAGEKHKNYRATDRLLVQFYRMRYLQPGQRSRLAILADLLAETLNIDEKWRLAKFFLNENRDDAQLIGDLIYQDYGIDASLLSETRRDVAEMIESQSLWEQHKATTESFTVEAVFKQFEDDESLKVALDHARDVAKAGRCGDQAHSCLSLVEACEASLSLCPVEKYRVYVNISLGRLSLFQAESMEKVFLEEKEKFADLEEEHPNDLKLLKARLELGRQYPRSASLDDLTGRSPMSRSLTKTEVCSWLMEAAAGWLLADLSDYAEASVSNALKAFSDSQKDEYSPEALLPALDTVSSVMDNFSLRVQAGIFEARGIVYEQLNEYSSAYAAHESARNLYLQADQIGSAAWNLEKMAWSKMRQQSASAAEELLKQALKERLEEGKLESVAWIVGQLARLECSTSGVSQAWAELELALEEHPESDQVWAIQQMGDAVADCAAQQGDSQAFAMGKEILTGLAARPQFAAEAVLRSLWIDMVDMSVPYNVQRDLLDEWPILWPAEEFPNVNELQPILKAWLDDLDTSAS